MNTSPLPTPSTEERLIGILGGMGPHAHLIFERCLLDAAQPVHGDQDYPEWLLASISQTPDRTRALVADGRSPVDAIVAGLERLQRGGAEFAVITCITAHAFLPEVRQKTSLPLIDILEQTLLQSIQDHGPAARVGLLSTDGTLRSGLFPSTADRVAPDITWQTLSDDDEAQARVMRAIYGIKASTERDPETGVLHSKALADAAARLLDRGADVVICGCTEISLAFYDQPTDVPLMDPLRIAARIALKISRGEQEIP